MPHHPAPVFMLWYTAAKTGRWAELMAMEATPETRVAFQGLQELQLFEDYIQQKLLERGP